MADALPHTGPAGHDLSDGRSDIGRSDPARPTHHERGKGMGGRMKWVFALMACAQIAAANDAGRSQTLLDEMGFHRAMRSVQATCVEKAEATDVEQQAADSPALFAEIQPSDPRWDTARALYVDMLTSACAFDMAPAAHAYAQALTDGLDAHELDALIAFYRSDLGRRFEAASQAGNVAVDRVLKPIVDPAVAYATFEEGIQQLAAGGDAAPAAGVVPRIAASAALESGDDAVRLSDRMMHAIVAGDVRAALAMAAPYSVLPPEAFETLATQFDTQSALVTANYGRSVEHVLLTNDSVGGALMRNVYLHRHERYATVWLFLWYRSEAGWTLTTLRFADDLNSLFR
ncbi:DUF2059 domain-containing protein [Luteimonas sp. WGS1318]|uniref:DUF2059 domain-containing protein n=1 Tax=Luteimonas sp. WGS1318 TaxID=3366815 RepID=UPI00372D036E